MLKYYETYGNFKSSFPFFRRMKVVTGSRSALEQEVTGLLAEGIIALLQRKKQIVVALPGGRSIRGILQKMALAPFPWDKIHFFLVDERSVSPRSKERNFFQAQELLFTPLLAGRKISRRNLHPCEPVPNAEKYTRALQRCGGTLDLVILGVGEDGHVASLFPHHPSVRSNEKGYISARNSPKSPRSRISASRRLLQSASMAILLFFGREKKKAYARFIRAGAVEDCPAKAVRGVQHLYVFKDFS